jgi:RNA-binding protein
MLTSKQKQELKGKAHKLKPIIMIGNKGLSEPVAKEIDRALTDHELIKVRVQGVDRDGKRELLTQICEIVQAELVQHIGNIGVIYRAKI